jgi:choline dehydrogenase-like flavoprotein
MSSIPHYDVIIIGTGAGGGTLAWRLAPSGKRILLLERGDFVRRERENWDPRAAVTEARYHADETWFDRHGAPFRPGTHYNVGGNTKFYGAALFRLRAEDFGELKHHGGVSPAWPLGYEDFEPYYAEAERLYRVHGRRGEDPTEPAAKGPYPFPPVSHEPRIQRLHDDLERLGMRPFHVPVGVMLDESDPLASACIRCGTCDAFPCLLNAKADTDVLCVRPALRHPNVTLLTRALVRQLETDTTGRAVARVHVERDGVPESYAADLVVVSAGAINSAALLLRSASDRHPTGLANRSGVVGRHYMCHTNSMLVALSKEPNPTLFHKTFALTDFYFGADDFPYPMGSIQMMGKAHPEVLAEGAPRGTPHRLLRLLASHGIPFWLTSEDLPDPGNRVAIGSHGEIQLHYRDNNLEGHKRLHRRLKALLAQAGCDAEHLLPTNLYIGGRIPVAGVAHQCGTVRFGTDPTSSALDVHCRAHDVDNLYVVDGSFFPSSSAVNPALTIAANALRVGDHLLERLA